MTARRQITKTGGHDRPFMANRASGSRGGAYKARRIALHNMTKMLIRVKNGSEY